MIEVDLGIDWRAHEPINLGVGPVLDREDAVGNKGAALYSRGEIRDYLDVDAIRQSGDYTDDELLRLISERDPGFDLRRFIHVLRRSALISLRRVSSYDVSEDGLAEVTSRLSAWADKIEGSLLSPE